MVYTFKEIMNLRVKRPPHWIGVDLDATLAEMHKDWTPVDYHFIGPVISRTMKLVKALIKKGWLVKILTARAAVPEWIPPVEEWLEIQGLGGMEVTNEKDPWLVFFLDDKAVQVVPNKGLTVAEAMERRR